MNFAPTETARQNLLRENKKDSSIFVVGNTVIDALLHTVKKDYHSKTRKSKPLKNIKGSSSSPPTAVKTWEIPCTRYTGPCAVWWKQFLIRKWFPVHRNPLVREAVSEELEGVPGIHLVEPMEYEPFTNLMARSAIVLTDSGGIQEEAPSLGKPVLVLRDTTERPEAVEAGTVRLVGTNEEKVFETAYKLLTDDKEYRSMAEAVNPYGDGHAAGRIVDALLWIEGISDKKPAKFIAK